MLNHHKKHHDYAKLMSVSGINSCVPHYNRGREVSTAIPDGAAAGNKSFYSSAYLHSQKWCMERCLHNSCSIP